MNSDEISREIEKAENNLEKVVRGDDDKFLAVNLVRATWEVAHQLSLLRERE